MVSFLILCISPALWLSAETIVRPPATSNDGLEVTHFGMKAKALSVNSPFSMTFRLKNVSDHDITFHPDYGVFFGTRWNTANKDFGHDYKGYVLPPGQSIQLNSKGTFEQPPGTWTFWPAYHTNGHWGPYKWNAIVVEITD